MNGDIYIGHRAAEEVRRLADKARIPVMTLLKRERIKKSLFYSWTEGICPGGGYLQRLYYIGADIEYILTGRRNR